MAVLASLIVVVLTIAYSLGGVYNKRWLNVLEAWFLLNTAVVASLATIDEQSVAEAVVYTSVSLVLLSFIVIMVYHIYCVLQNTKVGNNMILKMKNKYFNNSTEIEVPSISSNTMILEESNNTTRSSVVIQRESMIFDSSL